MTRKMKDSGIEWIGEIPEEWETTVLKRIVVDRQSGVWGKDEIVDSLNNKICIRVADFDFPNMTVRKDRPYTFRNYTEKEIIKYRLKKEDILIEKSGGGEKMPVGRTIIWDQEYEALFANFIERIRVDKMQILPMFAQFCFYSFYKNGGTKLYFNQTTGIQNLDITKLLNEVKFPIPSIDSQRKIVKLVNNKCLEIKKLKKFITQQIQTLEEYKKSLITEAVTKGLDKNVKMKESGIEWIGEIPEHWELIKLKNIATTISKGISPNYVEEELTPVVNQATFSKGYFDYNLKYCSNNIQSDALLKKNDVLIATTGGGVLGKTYFFQEDEKYLASTDVAFIRTNILDLSKLIYYFLSTKYDLLNGIFAKGSTNQIHLQMDMLINMHIAIPSEHELRVIISYLDKVNQVVDDSIKQKHHQLEVLEEYKKSLIYEYVTGKKEVSHG